MNAAFFASVRSSLFGGKITQPQVDALDTIGSAWARYGDGDTAKLAYVLATAFHETGRFRFMREVWGPTPAQKKYEGRADLGNTLKGDGKKFMGRGFVQITGRRNYADWSKRLGMDLVKEPQMAEQPAVAARILVQGSMMGTFTGKKLGDYTSFANMRRVINGTDKAALIAGYAQKFFAALGDGVSANSGPKPQPIPTAPLPEPEKSKSPIAAIVAGVIALGAAIYAFLKAQGVLP